MTKYVALNDIGTFEVSDGSFGYWTTYEGDADGGLWIKSDGSNQGFWDYDEGTTDSGSWYAYNESDESGTWTRDDTDFMLIHITIAADEQQYDGSWVGSDDEITGHWWYHDSGTDGSWVSEDGEE